MSFSALPLSLARAFTPSLDDDELERQRRIKLAGTEQAAPVRGTTVTPQFTPVARAGVPEGSSGVGVIAPEDRLYGRVSQPAADPLPSSAALRFTMPVVADAGPAPPPRATLDPQRVDTSQRNPMSVDFNAPTRATASPYADVATSGPATKRAEEMLSSGPAHHEHMGIGERLMHGLKLGGTAFLRSGFNPTAALGGFAEGAIDPQSWDDYKFDHSMPRALAASNAEQDIQNNKLKRAHTVEQMTDRDPFTGEIKPSVRAMMDYRGMMAQAATVKAQTGKYSAIARTQHWENLDKSSRQKLVKGLVDNGEVNVNDQDDMEWAANELGVPPHLKPAFKAGAIKVNDKFQYVDVRTGQPVADEQGQPVVSSQAAVEGKKSDRFNRTQSDRERHEKEMESQGRQHIGIAQQNTDINRARAQNGSGADRREALRGIDQHNRYKKEANDLYAQADRFRQQSEAAKNDSEREKLLARATEAERRADDRKRSANNSAQELQADYPDHVEVGQQDGWYYAKPRAGVRATGTAPRTTPPAAQKADASGYVPSVSKQSMKDPRDGKTKNWIYRGISPNGKQLWEVVE